jgi:predicted DNA-binding transcriptional regulator AlpA
MNRISNLPGLEQSHGVLLRDREVAALLGVSLASVRRWRLMGQGPVYRKLGALCRYSRGDVEAWLASRPTGGQPVAR